MKLVDCIENVCVKFHRSNFVHGVCLEQESLFLCPASPTAVGRLREKSLEDHVLIVVPGHEVGWQLIDFRGSLRCSRSSMSYFGSFYYHAARLLGFPKQDRNVNTEYFSNDAGYLLLD